MQECKRMLVRLAMKHQVPPKLISERLLSEEDKADMLSGEIAAQTLDCHIATWVEFGMCNYAEGELSQYELHRAYKKVMVSNGVA